MKHFWIRYLKLLPIPYPQAKVSFGRLQKKRGDDKLRYPGESDTYEKEAMDKLGL